MSLPAEITIQTTKGDREVGVLQLGPTEVPDHDGGGYAYRLVNRYSWDGFSRDDVKPHLETWTVPSKVQEIADRAESIFEDGIPDQRRRMLRNQDFGMLDDRWVSDIAIGEEVERPWQRWTKSASDPVSVAICIDSTVACMQGPEILQSRMAVAAGLTSALELLDYSVSIVGACLQIALTPGGSPRTNPSHAKCFATVVKDEDEPFVESGFAHFANTGLRRLMNCWVKKDNGRNTQMTDDEWRELTGADLFIYVGAQDSGGNIFNNEGLPRDAKLGPAGDDVVRLGVDSFADVDAAIATLERFFQERFGE